MMMTKTEITTEQKVTLNLNDSARKEKEECSLHDLINIGLKSGRWFFFGTSYSIQSTHYIGAGSDFVVKNYLVWKYFLRLLHILFFSYLMIPFFTDSFAMSPCSLVNWLKQIQHVILVCWIITTDYCLEVKGRRETDGGLISVYRQCIVVQARFNRIGLRFPMRSKVWTFGWAIVMTTFLVCIIRQYIFASTTWKWYSRNIYRMFTMGIWVADTSTISHGMELLFGAFGIVFDGLLTNFWIFGQFTHFFFVLTIWMVFRKLNEAWESGRFQLPEIIDLHFQSTKLLKLINELIAPLTFWSLVFNISILCYWANYIAMDQNLRPTYIAGVCNFIKVAVELMLAADVNWKAHRITEWLEESCATTAKFPSVDPVKLTIFTTQIYNQDTIGFRGLNYFVITSRLVTTVVGIVITYSVAVNQFCHSY